MPAVALPVLSTTTDLRCQGCGACCMLAGIPPFTTAEITMLPADLQSEVIELILTGRRPGVPCAWFDRDTRLCTRYSHRPNACRTFAPGSDACEQMRKAML